jgi:hypothetical protein
MAVLGIPQLLGWGENTYSSWRNLRKERGTVFAQEYFKKARWTLVKKFARDPVTSPGVRVDRHGFPTVVPKELRILLIKSPTRLLRAVALMLLSLHLCYTGKREVSYATITTPLSTDAERSVAELRRHFKVLLPALAHDLGIYEALRLGELRYHISNRGGPNGHALLNAHLDAAAVLQSTEVGGSLSEWLSKVYPQKGPALWQNLNRVGRTALELGFVGDRRLALGKIGLKREPMKNRIFAISDYWTQASLKPLHVALMEVLRKIPQDATWNQDSGAQLVQKWTAEGRQLWSFDLSAATDRFPRDLQSDLVTFLLRRRGARLGDIWARLLTDRGYVIPRSTTTVKYAVGQPMGSYSSWAVFALTHHMMVRWAARRAAVNRRFTEYTILGDDIVIANEGVALQYQELMRLLGVDINRTKSVCSLGAAEFAKRTFVDGEELTGILWSMCSEAQSPFGMYQLVCELTRRGFKVSPAGCVQSVLGRGKDTRKVSTSVRALLLALVEPGGPLESQVIWRRVLPAALKVEYFEAFLEEDGTLAEDPASVRTQDSARWAIAKQLSAGVAVAPLLRAGADFEALKGSLSSLLGEQLLSSSKGTSPSNTEVRTVLEHHPVMLITTDQLQEEFGFPRRVSRLRILSRADKEYRTSQHQRMTGAVERAELGSVAYGG